MATLGSSTTAVKLWDLPVRVVHWSFVLLLPGLWWTANKGDIDTHLKLGTIMLTLVVFRILWGLFGSSTARFATFVRGPVVVARYVRGLFGKEGQPIVGHNPLGALSVVALLLLLAAQVGFGLVAQDTDGLYSGPLNYLVSYDTAEAARSWHELGFNVILAVVAIHVLAIGFYLVFKRDNLVMPMVTGRKRYNAAVATPAMAPLWRLALCLVVALGAGWWVWSGAPGLAAVLPAATT
ncbi:MAG: Ni/Fe-hydrogenase 1 b-type cytochrome subunit [Novosphingobium sp.]|nr:Ni/Fe-hydrogenase 1 b-type cytochrome subunit [Novosphingobium sp.]